MPVVLRIKVKRAAKVGISSTLDLPFFDRVDRIGTGAVKNIVLNGILGVVEPSLFDETALDEAVVVVFEVLERVVRERLCWKKLGRLGGCT